MSASAYDYKTVALPQTVQGKRKRGQSEADRVAMALGETIHDEAVDGWEYLRSDVLAAQGRGGMFSKEPAVTYYTVLVFRRSTGATWMDEREEEVRPVAAPADGPTRPLSQAQAGLAPQQRQPLPHPDTRAATAPSQQAAPPMIGDPTSPLAHGALLTTGGEFRSEAPEGNRPAARPPLGSAQD